MNSANNHSSEFIIKTLKDEPIDDAKLLGVKETANTLYSFLVSDTLISPLVIAVNGEWGSGKTSLINTVKRRLEEDRQTVVFFDAWKYEYSDPAAALFYTIAKRLELTKQDFKYTAFAKKE